MNCKTIFKWIVLKIHFTFEFDMNITWMRVEVITIKESVRIQSWAGKWINKV